MHVLFISFSAISLKSDSVRSVAMIKALADAGHRVDVVAPAVDLAAHAQLSCTAVGGTEFPGRIRLMLRAFALAGRTEYDVVHAVDEAVFWVSWLARLRRLPFVYDAVRRFVGPSAAEKDAPLGVRLFPQWFRRCERQVLARARLVLSSCRGLTDELRALDKDMAVAEIEDVPLQSLVPKGEPAALVFDPPPSALVVGWVSAVGVSRVRNVLVAARKMIEVMPDAAFVLRGMDVDAARQLAEHLDIAGRCRFVEAQELDLFLEALARANAALLVTRRGARAVDPHVFSLLAAGVPLVSVHGVGCDEVLSEETCVAVPDSVDSIAEGLLRVVREPLFSQALGAAGRQKVVERHSLSSFKHKVRMAYYQQFKKE